MGYGHKDSIRSDCGDGWPGTGVWHDGGWIVKGGLGQRYSGMGGWVLMGLLELGLLV